MGTQASLKIISSVASSSRLALDWHIAVDLGGFLIVIAGGAVAYGRLQQKVVDMGKVVDSHAQTLQDHAKQLADGAGNFKVIDTKLDFIKESVTNISSQLSQHVNGESR